MALPTPQYVRDLSLSGEFNTLTDDQIEGVILDEVAYMYAWITSEDLHARVVGLHTAHILKSQLMEGGGNQPGPQGPLTHAKVGQVEKRWGLAAQPVAPSAGLDATTSYGRRCMRLLQSRVPSVMTSQT